MNIIFAGTPDFAATSLQALLDSHHQIIGVYTQPDRPAGRGRELKPSPVKQLALQHSLKVLQPQTLRDEREQKILMNLSADIMIVVAYGLILPLSILMAPTQGCLNVHASLLPKWRGAAPIQRAILVGDLKTGITIMQMNEGLDTGDMLLKVECPIEKKDTSQLLHDRLAKLGAQALLETLNRLGKKSLHAEKQDEHFATYAHKISKEEAEIDWNKSAKEIDQQIRAFNPWPVAQTLLHEHIIRIWQAEAITESHHASTNVFGKLVQVNREGIDVQTGQGILRLQKLQLPGGRVLNVLDILNSRQDLFKPGVILG